MTLLQNLLISLKNHIQLVTRGIYGWFISLCLFPVDQLSPKLFVYRVQKLSLMGHLIDKTYEYYFSSMVTTSIETDMIIDFRSYGVDHSCICKSQNFEQCIKDLAGGLDVKRLWSPSGLRSTFPEPRHWIWNEGLRPYAPDLSELFYNISKK